MRIAIASDHAAYELKALLAEPQREGGDDGQKRIPRGVQEQDPPLRQALHARHHDVVLLQHVEHAHAHFNEDVVEVNRGLVADPFVPFGESPISPTKVARMSQPIADALLSGDGVYAPFLKLARALEGFDDKHLTELAADLHISADVINRAHLEALGFADSLQFG